MTAWRSPELDDAAADALAVITLYAGGRPEDIGMASELLDELVSRPQGVEHLVGGLVSISGALLALLEHQAGIPPAEGLEQVGRIVLQVAEDGCV